MCSKCLPGDGLGDGHDDDVNDETDEQVDPELGQVPQVQARQGQEEPRDTVTRDLNISDCNRLIL